MITPEQLGERYLAVHHRMFRAVNDEMNGCGLSMARTKVLMRLQDQGPTRQSVLAADLGLAPHSITDIVDGLERQGLAQRRPDTTDRRAKLVAITDAGQACLDVATGIRERLLTQIFGALSEDGPGHPAPPAGQPRPGRPAGPRCRGPSPGRAGSDRPRPTAAPVSA